MKDPSEATLRKKVLRLRAEMQRDQRALERDAIRYRFLRERKIENRPNLTRHVGVVVYDWPKNLNKEKAGCQIWSQLEITGLAMDAEVDRQMRKAKRKSKSDPWPSQANSSRFGKQK